MTDESPQSRGSGAPSDLAKSNTSLPVTKEKGFFDYFIYSLVANWPVLAILAAIDAVLQIATTHVMSPWMTKMESMGQEISTDPNAALELMTQFWGQMSIYLFPMLLISVITHLATNVVVYQNLKEGESPSEWIGQTLRRLLPTILLALIATALISAGMLFLLVPGMVLAFLSIYGANFCANKNQGPWTSFQSSLSLAWKNKGRTFLLWCIIIAGAILYSLPAGILGAFLPADFQWVLSVTSAIFTRMLGTLITIMFMSLLGDI